MEILLFIAFFGAAASIVLFNLYRRAKQIHELLKDGVPAQGTLSSKRRITQKGRARFIFSYEYEADGRRRKGRSVVSHEVFDAHEEGQVLAVRYLATKPSVSAPEFVLEKARKDLKRR